MGGCWAVIQLYSEPWVKMLAVGAELLVVYISLRWGFGWILEFPIQSSPLTVTPLGQEKSVAVSKRHSNHIIFDKYKVIWDLSKLSL